MNSRTDVIDLADVAPAAETAFDFDAVFRSQYLRIARVIARVVRDPARSEELAVEVFLKLWRSPRAQRGQTQGWLYRVAVRKALDELRRQTRRERYEKLSGMGKPAPNPEQAHAATEEQQRVRSILMRIEHRQAELLLLRANDLSYEEVAAALALNPASVGTLLSRAQQAFRKEYINRYGQH
jgi:RNA polymerase sigma-70 factor, ECF subfamily